MTAMTQAFTDANITPATITHDAGFYLSGIGDGVPPLARRGLYQSIIGSLNISIVNALKIHYRKVEREVPTEPTIDTYNEAIAAINEALENDAARYEQGFERTTDHFALAESFIEIRKFFCIELDALEAEEQRIKGMKLANSGGMPIAMTLKTLLQPQRPDINTIKAEAHALEIDPEHLMAAKLEASTRDAAELAKHASSILFTAKDLHDQDYDADPDTAFDALPVQYQVRLIAAVLRAFEKRAIRATNAFVQTKKLDALGEYKLLVGRRKELIEDAHAFCRQRSDKINRLIDEGVSFPILPDAV